MNFLTSIQPEMRYSALTRDALGNPYLFVHNSSVAFVDSFGLVTIPGPDEIWNKLPDDVKDFLHDYMLGKTLKDAKAACDKYDKCTNKADPNAVADCQLCAVYQCAKKVVIGDPAAFLMLKNCLTGKFSICGEGLDPGSKSPPKIKK